MSTPPEQPPPAYTETEREQMSVVDTPQSIPRVQFNGGSKAWASVAGAFLLQFCSLGYLNAYGLPLICLVEGGRVTRVTNKGF